ncbi:MAG: BrnT family toxin, partial [Nevskiales bacterium]
TWDARKRLTNLREHGIDLAEVGPVFEGDMLTREDDRYPYGEQRFQSLGMLNGVVVFVAWTLRGETLHAISCRKANEHERKAYFSQYHWR